MDSSTARLSNSTTGDFCFGRNGVYYFSSDTCDLAFPIGIYNPTMTTKQVKATISLLACLIATGCAQLDAFFEEEPKTCDEACEDTYIDCLEWAYDTVTDTSSSAGTV